MEITAGHKTTIHSLADAFRKVAKDPNAYRAAMSASRAQWGDDVHEVLKGRAMSGVYGGRA